MSDDLLLSLETKLDRLILLCNRLQQENAQLKARESEWQRERERLIEKNERQARPARCRRRAARHGRIFGKPH